jgi:hypothetical protein
MRDPETHASDSARAADDDARRGVGDGITGYGPGMAQLRTWHLTRHATVRADAPGIYVPSQELPQASIGDVVIVEGPADEASSRRQATVSAVDTRDGVAYLRLDFISPR